MSTDKYLEQFIQKSAEKGMGDLRSTDREHYGRDVPGVAQVVGGTTAGAGTLLGAPFLLGGLGANAIGYGASALGGAGLGAGLGGVGGGIAAYMINRIREDKIKDPSKKSPWITALIYTLGIGGGASAGGVAGALAGGAAYHHSPMRKGLSEITNAGSDMVELSSDLTDEIGDPVR